MKRHIGHPRVEGTASRQAHCDLPPGTYEREMSKEGFFGPAAFFHHRHPPTGWSSFEGPLRPHAFDLTQLEAVSAHPWAAAEILHNAHCRIRFWRTAGRMDGLARNADGDELLFVHQRARGSVLRFRPPARSRRATTSCCRAARCGGSSARSPPLCC